MSSGTVRTIRNCHVGKLTPSPFLANALSTRLLILFLKLIAQTTLSESRSLFICREQPHLPPPFAETQAWPKHTKQIDCKGLRVWGWPVGRLLPCPPAFEIKNASPAASLLMDGMFEAGWRILVTRTHSWSYELRDHTLLLLPLPWY
jgi:hypothetical protein